MQFSLSAYLQDFEVISPSPPGALLMNKVAHSEVQECVIEWPYNDNMGKNELDELGCGIATGNGWFLEEIEGWRCFYSLGKGKENLGSLECCPPSSSRLLKSKQTASSHLISNVIYMTMRYQGTIAHY